MILQALYEYYQRRADDPNSGMAPLGLEWKEIPFIIIIDYDGNFIRIEDQAYKDDNGINIKSFLVPQAIGRSGSSSWQTAYDFWDHYGYVMGITKSSVQKKGTAEKKNKAIEDAKKQNNTFIKRVKQLSSQHSTNSQFKAVKLFYDNTSNLDAIKEDPLFEQLTKKDGTNISFRIVGEQKIIAEHMDLYPIEKNDTEADTNIGVCLITGDKAPIKRLHSELSIGRKSNAKIVSFNHNPFCSYNKEQGFNAPVSIKAEMAYSTALKTLLNSDSPNNYKLGDIQFVFWAQKECEFENYFQYFFTAPSKDNPDRNIEAIRALMQAPFNGKFSDEENTQFFLLGLTPYETRISIRSWNKGTVKEFAEKIRLHFNDLEIIRSSKDEREFFSIFNVLTQVAFEYKISKLPPNIIGDMIKAIINGTQYPVSLQIHCLNRIKVDNNISYIRAAILKAYINRKERFTTNSNKPITMALDKENTNQAYLYGRLFATLEKIQEDALSSANIREHYYAGASSTPSAIFPRLLNLKNFHIQKLSKGNAIVKEKLIGEIVEAIDSNGFLKRLTLDDQSRFAIGYYHQRQDFFTAKENKNENNN